MDSEIKELNLHDAATALKNTVLSKAEADKLRNFIRAKIENGTLYTSDEMAKYPESKRCQLFVNSNIAEHEVVYVLHGKLLEGNDILTVDSVAVIGEDGCALADVLVDGIGVEVKVVFNNNRETLNNVLNKAHKQPVVAVYTIKADDNDHWRFYYRTDLANLAKLTGTWQTTMNAQCEKLPLLSFTGLADGRLAIKTMY